MTSANSGGLKYLHQCFGRTSARCPSRASWANRLDLRSRARAFLAARRVDFIVRGMSRQEGRRRNIGKLGKLGIFDNFANFPISAFRLWLQVRVRPRIIRALVPDLAVLLRPWQPQSKGFNGLVSSVLEAPGLRVLSPMPLSTIPLSPAFAGLAYPRLVVLLPAHHLLAHPGM